jgi:pullulanase/glycogen debranching enzyme
MLNLKLLSPLSTLCLFLVTTLTLAEVPPVRAELQGERAVWVKLQDPELAGLSPSAFRLLDAKGTVIPVEAVLPNTGSELLLVPSEPLELSRFYQLEIPERKLKVRCRHDGWFRNLYSSKPLGANVSEDGKRTRFGVFAPRASGVVLHLYQDPTSPEYSSAPMKRDPEGVWESEITGDLHGLYYDFTVEGPREPGNHFPARVSDPYARVNVEAHGRSRVWRATRPATPLKGGIPPMESVVAYEVHVQDFTDTLPGRMGPLTGMITAGLKNSKGQPIGFDHLVDLGINVVHLMPVQEYLHYPAEEWKEAFAEDRMARKMGVADSNYQWGYRTTHALAVENRYRTPGSEHGAQREQFRDLVQAFHNKGIAVIIDIVPNHTGENMDGRRKVFNFNGLDAQYYYRTGDQGELIGPYGNEVKTEERPMVQRWLVDQCRHFIEEFGIDGFRIDLAGQIDEQSLRLLRRELGPEVIVYGEPWIDVSDPYVKANPDWDWYKEDSPITFFQDSARDAFVGSPFKLEDKTTDRGYAGGNTSLRAAAQAALANSYQEESESPNLGLNYLDIHDNWALADRFAVNGWDGRQGVHEDRYRVAAGMLLTSLGPVVLHGGSEFMRSKGLAPLKETSVKTETAEIHFKGRDDTYNVLAPNRFLWEDLGRSNYRAMADFWKGLIAFRLSPKGEVFRQAEVDSDHYRWILPEDSSLLGYVVGESVLVLVNVGEESGVFPEVRLGQGVWRPVCNGVTASPDPVYGRTLQGGKHKLKLPGATIKIWARS